MQHQIARQIILQPVEALIPYARNSRTHSDEQVAQIAASIREFGFTNPVLIDEDGSIVAGHGRVAAAKQLGIAEVPTIVLGHLTAAERRAYVTRGHDRQTAPRARHGDIEETTGRIGILSTRRLLPAPIQDYDVVEFQPLGPVGC